MAVECGFLSFGCAVPLEGFEAAVGCHVEWSFLCFVLEESFEPWEDLICLTRTSEIVTALRNWIQGAHVSFNCDVKRSKKVRMSASCANSAAYIESAIRLGCSESYVSCCHFGTSSTCSSNCILTGCFPTLPLAYSID